MSHLGSVNYTDIVIYKVRGCFILTWELDLSLKVPTRVATLSKFSRHGSFEAGDDSSTAKAL